MQKGETVMFNLKKEVAKNLIVSGAISAIACFVIVYNLIPVPPNAIGNGIGNAISGFISGGISAAVTVVAVSKKLSA